MPFLNRIRLPFKVTRPQYPDETTKFRKANGVSKTISVTIRKTLEGETDWMPEKWHERLRIALSHDDVTIEGDRYLTGIVMGGGYEIDWLKFLDYPAAPAKFTVEVTPFNATNSNCQTCEEATQVDLTDDWVLGVYIEIADEYAGLEEETEYTINVADNDSICCYPAVFSITSFDTTYLDSAVIDQNGNLTVVIGDNVPVANNIVIARYRVTCPNGGYDEANVYANINGTVEACLAPTSIGFSGLMATSVTVAWMSPDPAPASGYLWELYRDDTPGSPEQTGSVDPDVFVDLVGLTPGVTYNFYVNSDCGATASNAITIQFTTVIVTESETCGQYSVIWYDGTGIPSNYSYITYMDCNSDYQTVIVYNSEPRIICALQTTAGVPVDIVGANEIYYLGLC